MHQQDILSIHIYLAFSKHKSHKASIPGMLALYDLYFENAKCIYILKSKNICILNGFCLVDWFNFGFCLGFFFMKQIIKQ